MITTPTVFDTVTSQRKLSPLLICSAPRPSEVAVPDSVAKIARLSIVRPSGCSLARSPSSGVNVALTRFGVPLRKVKYASADEAPAEVADHPVEHRAHHAREAVGAEHAPEDEGSRQPHRSPEDEGDQSPW
jgi:hypothetical protein